MVNTEYPELRKEHKKLKKLGQAGRRKGDINKLAMANILLIFSKSYPMTLTSYDIQEKLSKIKGELIKNRAGILNNHLNPLEKEKLILKFDKHTPEWKINHNKINFKEIVNRMFKFNLIFNFLRSNYFYSQYPELFNKFITNLAKAIDKTHKPYKNIETKKILYTQLLNIIGKSPSAFEMFFKLLDKNIREVVNLLSPIKDRLYLESVINFFKNCIVIDQIKGYDDYELKKLRAIILKHEKSKEKIYEAYLNTENEKAYEQYIKQEEEYYANHPELSYDYEELMKGGENKS